MDLVIEVDDKRFARNPSRPVLCDIRFAIRDGEFVALIGPSGCGKSTLLNIVAGLDPEFTGRITWPGSGRRLGYVFQNPRLLPWLTLRDNIRLVLDDPRAASARIDRLLEAMALREFAGYHPGRVSVGMQRRVALARAFVVQPELLLMDEPFVSLDAPTAEQLRGLLLDVWEQQRCRVLFVTHDLREAVQLADRILFMSASPARVLAEVEVGVARHRRMSTAAIDARLHELQHEFERHYGTAQGNTFVPPDSDTTATDGLAKHRRIG